MGCYVYSLFVVALLASIAVSSNIGPEFDCSLMSIAVSLNDTTPIGSVVLKGNNTELITELLSCDLLELNVSQGALILTKSLTPKCDDSYPCQLRCVQQERLVVMILTIQRTIVYNVSFDNDTYFASIAENSVSGSPIRIGVDGTGVNFRAMGCEPTNDRFELKFSILDQNVPFEWGSEGNINSLRSKGTVDFDERPHVYTLTLKGEISKLNGSAKATIIVTVIDEDDQNPRFNITDGNDYIIEIPEEDKAIANSPVTTVPPVQAYDPDFGINATVNYRIKTITPSSSDLFTIDINHGTFNVTRELDFETQPQYRIIIEAFQVNNPSSRTAQATVIVVVKDMDDHKPRFDPDFKNVTILEHSSSGIRVCDVRAIDPDAGANGFINYTLRDDTNAFVLETSDNYSAVLIVKAPSKIDREIQDMITVIIEPSTHDGKTGQNNLTVTIRLEDINDNSPVFNKAEYSFMYVNQSAGASLGQVVAKDNDMGENAKLHYEIVNGTMNAGDCIAESPFILNNTTGDIVMRYSNFPCDWYHFVVQACDNPYRESIGRRCSVATVAVAKKQDGALSYSHQEVNVTESAAINTYVTQLMCGGTGVVYKINSNTSVMPFGVYGNGMLKTNELLDRENTSTYELLVEADLYGQVKCTFNISINVLDVNDNAPQFISDTFILYAGNIPAVGSIVGMVLANDSDVGDNGIVNYSFNTKSGQSYIMNGSSGEISLVSPDHVRDIEQLVVIAADQGTPRYEASVVVYVLSGDAGTSSVPLNTPLQKGQITNKKETLERGIAEILNQSVVISSVDPYEKSPHKSRIFITATVKSVETSTLVRQVFNKYEEIRTLFYSALESADTKSSHSDLGAPEIGLIVMAVVILVGTSIAIVFINRQFNSHKRYKKLYETLNKDSSMYESQEVSATMESESGSANTHEPAVVTENPLFSGDEANIVSETSNDVVETKVEESTSVKEAIDSLDQRLQSEENERKIVVNSEDLTDETLESNGENPDIQTSDGGSDTVVYANVKMNKTESDGSNGQVNTETQADCKAKEFEHADAMLEEPNPDYDRKEVRFNVEVLDADENKMTPLKVKDEEHIIGEGDDTSNVKSNENGDDVMNKPSIERVELENSNMHNEDNPTIDFNEEPYENVINGPILTPDTEVEVDEIVSPSHDITSDNNSQVDFYFAEEVSTHF